MPVLMRHRFRNLTPTSYLKFQWKLVFDGLPCGNSLNCHMMTTDDIKPHDMQSLMSLVCPQYDENVALYLKRASRALTVRTDMQLALTMGVTKASIANWKRRNAIPDDANSWFASTLIEKISAYNRELPQVSNDARLMVVTLLMQRYDNPLLSRGEGHATAHMLAGLLALSQFFLDRAADTNAQLALPDLVKLLVCSLRPLRRGLTFTRIQMDNW